MTAEQVRAHLLALGAPVEAVGAREPLFSTSRLDSFLLVDLLLILEQASGRVLDPASLRLSDLDTLEALASLSTPPEPP